MVHLEEQDLVAHDIRQLFLIYIEEPSQEQNLIHLVQFEWLKEQDLVAHDTRDILKREAGATVTQMQSR